LFAWPQKLVTHIEHGGRMQGRIGFRMKCVQDMRTLDHYLYQIAFKRLSVEERGWFIGRIACAIRIACAADRLAHMGLCYADFAEKNIMVNPLSGYACLIDCDSLTVPGELEATIKGTPWYCAPEIVTQQVKVPSLETDRHALAILFHLWLLGAHPLIELNGNQADEFYLGEQARYQAHYIEHQADPISSSLNAENLGPALQQLFEQAFIDGLHKPDLRPRPRSWAEALMKTYDWLIPCASLSCGWGFFIARPHAAFICPNCHTSLQEPMTLPFLYLLSPNVLTSDSVHTEGTEIGSPHYIVGWPERPLHQWHIQYNSTPLPFPGQRHATDTTPYAIFRYDSDGNWFLENCKMPNLSYYQPSLAQWQTCQIGGSVPLCPQTLIRFDLVDAYLASIVLYQVKR